MAFIWFQSGVALPALAALVGCVGAVLGIWLTGLRNRIAVVVPFSAGVLIGVALFGLLPELAEDSSWPLTLGLCAGGYGLLFFVNRYAYPICPDCAHNHDHSACGTELHGFAAPLIVAAALHSLLDGWSVAVVQHAAPLGLRVAVPIAIALHKVPEGVALGGVMRAAVPSRALALIWCLVAEGATLAGGGLALALAPHLGSLWTVYPLGLTAGWLIYLGYHAVHEEWKRKGAAAASVSALAGGAAAALIQRGAEALLR
ncbi:MAG: ZIP family metal transporter [Bryobacteraceae bacterium]